MTGYLLTVVTGLGADALADVSAGVAAGAGAAVGEGLSVAAVGSVLAHDIPAKHTIVARIALRIMSSPGEPADPYWRFASLVCQPTIPLIGIEAVNTRAKLICPAFAR